MSNHAIDAASIISFKFLFSQNMWLILYTIEFQSYRQETRAQGSLETF
jgi:hypothetical protein